MTKWGWVISGIAALAAVVLFIVVAVIASDDPDEGLAADTSLPATTTTVPEISSTTSDTTSTTSTSTSGPTTTTTATTVPPTAPPGTLPPAPDPDAGEETDNPVPYQTSLELGQWRIGVSLADLDATDTVLEFVPFNEPPEEGSVYVLVQLSGTYIGSSIAQAVFDWKLKAPGFDHTPDGLECGVIPDSIYDVGDVGQGGTITANVCFEVPAEFVNEDLLLSLGLFDASGVERFFSLS